MWSDTKRFPTAVIIEETGEQISLPPQALLTFGRLREINGIKANDIALVHKDPTLARQVSRWHFELRRMPEGLILRSVSVRPTDVNGIAMGKGEEAIITPGSLVRLSGVLTLRFFSNIHSGFHEDDASTVIS